MKRYEGYMSHGEYKDRGVCKGKYITKKQISNTSL